MEEDMVALRWNNHLTTLSQLLYSLREEEAMIDATLACEGRLFPAHKLVLSMCSDYFKEMFTSSPCKHPIIYLKDVKCEDMEHLLDFMYRGVVHIQQESLNGLLKTAEGLQIRGLGVFAREAAAAVAASDHASSQGSEHSLTSASAPESSVLMSPDRKRLLESEKERRVYDIEHEPSLVAFSDGDLEDASHPQSHHAPPKKPKEDFGPPAPIPDLPKVSENMLDMGGGATINSADYLKFRRTTANRYINELLRYFFPVEVLASSSLTGGECFANKDKGPSNKNQLDPCIIRVITHDAIRNFPKMNEKQVRNAIRRKLNTESRTFRGLTKHRRNTTPKRKMKYAESPRALVSIEKSDRDKEKGPPVGFLVTPNISLEKTSPSESRRTFIGQSQSSNPERSSQPVSESRSGDNSYFTCKQDRAQTPHTGESLQSQTGLQPGTTSSSATPTPVATPTLPATASSPASTPDKSFNVVKTELPSGAQYLAQEYSYPAVMPTHMSQAYLPHHMASAEPSYLRRLEMGQVTPHPATLSYSYPHTTLSSSEPMEPNLHM